MAHEIIAPWAELVPNTGPMTVDELLKLPDDGWMYELVEGRLVRMPGSGFQASVVGMRLAAALLTFADAHDLGRVTGADGTYDLTQPGDTGATALVPDIAFVATGRLPQPGSPQYSRALRLAPDLVVEVASPSQYRPEMAAKARRYIDAGVRLVWIVWPANQQVDVWRPGAAQPTTTLTAGDSLDGLDALPGFTYPVANLFK